MPYSWPVDLDDVKAKLNEDPADTTNDAELQRVIDFATAILENHPAYRIADVVAVTTHTEDFSGGDSYVLKHYPVTAITSVTEYNGGESQVIAAEPITTTAFTAYGYRLTDSGILKRTANGYSTNWLGDVQVVYTTGSTSVPADIYGAALEFVEHLWRDQHGESALRPMAGVDTDFDREVIGRAGYLLPNRVAEALEAYRKEPSVR